MQPEVICLGEALIDISPLERGGNIIAGGKMQLAAGGAPANVAVGVARLGTPVGFIGRVGADFFGQHLKSVLEENGVDTFGLRLDNKTNTGLAFVSWNAQGDAEYLFYRNPSADTQLAPEDIDEDYLLGAKVLQFGSLLLANEPAASATFHALQLARKGQLQLSYDLNLRLTGWESKASARQAVAKPLDYATILKINRHELAFLTGESEPEAGVARLWRDNFRLVVVTLDSAGCYYKTAEAQGQVAAYKVEAVDTVGAGDGFMAGLLAKLCQHNFDFSQAVIEQACRQAAVCGAIAVTRPGAIPSLASQTEVAQFLAAHS